jgi:hypothetical protein
LDAPRSPSPGNSTASPWDDAPSCSPLSGRTPSLTSTSPPSPPRASAIASEPAPLLGSDSDAFSLDEDVAFSSGRNAFSSGHTHPSGHLEPLTVQTDPLAEPLAEPAARAHPSPTLSTSLWLPGDVTGKELQDGENAALEGVASPRVAVLQAACNLPPLAPTTRFAEEEGDVDATAAGSAAPRVRLTCARGLGHGFQT